jgi:RimJ/RimL family protein N-acetyltransferase
LLSGSLNNQQSTTNNQQPATNNSFKTMELIQAAPTDIPAIRELAHRIWWAHYPSIIGEAQVTYMLDLMYSEATLRRQIVEEGQDFWLPLLEGRPAGFLAVSRRGEGDYFLHKFYLDNERRGLGLGSRAFRLLLDCYPDLRELRLTVNRRNFTSINFYFKMGFIIEKCVDIPIGEGYVMEDFQMVWKR